MARDRKAIVTIRYESDGWRWAGEDADGNPVQSVRAFPHQYAAWHDVRRALAVEPYYDDKGIEHLRQVENLDVKIEAAPAGAPVYDHDTNQVVAAVHPEHPDTGGLSQVLPVGHPARQELS